MVAQELFYGSVRWVNKVILPTEKEILLREKEILSTEKEILSFRLCLVFVLRYDFFYYVVQIQFGVFSIQRKSNKVGQQTSE